ncbi:MAG: cyclic nucleotide-binding domain-containing protein [Proteobacteria bacterium]|nr:cyclic nucleotide-binding domain-containing protein [Pseudomonadota bacterium]
MVEFIWNSLLKNEKATLRKLLKSNILFQDLNPFELSLVENIVNVRNYRPGENIFRQGEVGVGMYIILSGSVTIFVEEIQENSQTAFNSKHTAVTHLKATDFFGELALVEDESRRSASASAHEETILVGFFKPDLLEIISRNPSAGVKILTRLSEVLGLRLRQTTARITELKRELKK